MEFKYIIAVPNNNSIPPTWKIYAKAETQILFAHAIYFSSLKKYCITFIGWKSFLSEKEIKEILKFLKKIQKKYWRPYCLW